MPLAAEAVGHIPTMVAQLAEVSNHCWVGDAGAVHRERTRAALRTPPPADHSASEAAGISPLDLVQTAADNTPADATVTVDAGAHFLAIMPLWPAVTPKQLLISNGLATMGYAVPAAVGAALARPDRPVLAMVGDGGLGMTLAELETVARLDLPITILVFNDSALSLIKIKQREGQGGEEVVSYRGTDFATIATGLGLGAIAVSTIDDLATALQGGWDRPRLIDVTVDPSDYSHLMRITRN